MAYGGNPSTNAIDRTRLLVGDVSTSTASEFLANNDYTFFNAQASNQYVQAQLAANSLAALFAGQAASASGSGFIEKKVGDLMIKKADASQAAQWYRSLGQKFGRMAAAGLTPYAGGLSIDEKQDVEDDTDRVRPAFLRNLFDNPLAMDAAGASTST